MDNLLFSTPLPKNQIYLHDFRENSLDLDNTFYLISSQWLLSDPPSDIQSEEEGYSSDIFLGIATASQCNNTPFEHYKPLIENALISILFVVDPLEKVEDNIFSMVLTGAEEEKAIQGFLNVFSNQQIIGIDFHDLRYLFRLGERGFFFSGELDLQEAVEEQLAELFELKNLESIKALFLSITIEEETSLSEVEPILTGFTNLLSDDTDILMGITLSTTIKEYQASISVIGITS